MKTEVATVLSGGLAIAQARQIQYELLDHSTLNEKFGVGELEVLGIEIPYSNVLVIGNGGHNFDTGPAGPYTITYKHKTTDLALFQHLPFIMRPIASDITGATQLKYRLRTIINVGGTNYIAYYGKALPSASVGVQYQTIVVDANGNITSTTQFTPAVENLNPVAEEIPEGTPTTTAGEYVVSSSDIEIILDSSEISEIRNCANILYGDPNVAVISELGVVSSVNRVISVTDVSGTVSYTEAIGAQVMGFSSPYYSLINYLTGLKLTLKLAKGEQVLSPSTP